MSLATRCTACGTIFRIVEDQLRVSDGWVRCGRCAEVFDARELLFDIERESPPAWPVPFTSSAPAPLAVAPAPEPESEPPAPPPREEAPTPARAADPEPNFDATVAMPLGPEYDATVAMPLDAAEGDRFEPRWVEPGLADAALHRADDAPAKPASKSPRERLEPDAVLPEFVRKAQAGERWKRPGVRLALGALGVLLLATLGLQATWHFHDAIAALYPGTKPLIEAICQPVGCKVGPWRRSEVLDIESTALTQIGNRNAYKLALTVRNKSSVEVATPWIELTVSDAAGVLVARRVLAPAQLSPALDHLAPEAEQGFSLNFTTGPQRVSGYTVNVFHP
jgi:predicted Zn finger-like uncharacterized protein